VFLGLISVCIARGNLGRAEALCERILERAAHAKSSAFEAAVARSLLGFTPQRRGHLAAAIPNLTLGAGLPLIGASGMMEQSIASESNLGFALFVRGEPRRGLETMRRADARAEATGHPPTIVYSASNMSRRRARDVGRGLRTARDDGCPLV
jgi:hypothetical protein